MATKTFRTPKGCIVTWAKIAPKGVEVGYRCPDSSGYRSENLRAFVKGAQTIHFPGGEIEGVGARAGFVLSPKHVRCEKTASARALTCRVFNERGAELSGMAGLDSSLKPLIRARSLYPRYDPPDPGSVSKEELWWNTERFRRADEQERLRREHLRHLRSIRR